MASYVFANVKHLGEGLAITLFTVVSSVCYHRARVHVFQFDLPKHWREEAMPVLHRYLAVPAGTPVPLPYGNSRLYIITRKHVPYVYLGTLLQQFAV